MRGTTRGQLFKLINSAGSSTLEMTLVSPTRARTLEAPRAGKLIRKSTWGINACRRYTRELTLEMGFFRTMERDPWVGGGFEQHRVTQTQIVNTPVGTPSVMRTVTAEVLDSKMRSTITASAADFGHAQLEGKNPVPAGPPPAYIPTPAG